jgi:hypothetical protein
LQTRAASTHQAADQVAKEVADDWGANSLAKLLSPELAELRMGLKLKRPMQSLNSITD